MFQKIEHLGIAVKNLSESIETFEALLDSKCYKKEKVESEFVETAFFRTGESKIELLGATDERSAIHKFVERKGEGLHHVAFGVEDIEVEVKRLISKGFKPLMEKPKKGADNKLIFFFHPKSTNGMLIELCQEIK